MKRKTISLENLCGSSPQSLWCAKTQMVENLRIKESEETKTSATKNIKNCALQSQVPPPIQFKQIDSKLHVLRTISKTKEVLNPFANKRYLLMDGVTSKAYGHYSIELSEDVFEA